MCKRNRDRRCVFCGRTPEESKSLHLGLRIGNRIVPACGDDRVIYNIKARSVSSIANTEIGHILTVIRHKKKCVNDFKELKDIIRERMTGNGSIKTKIPETILQAIQSRTSITG